MFPKASAWINRYERHLSALAMLAGFVADSLFFGRIDLWQTHAVFAVYTVICFLFIPLLHWMESNVKESLRFRFIPLLVTQFAIGGFLSGLVVFYGRSATLGVSWPFLLFLVLVFLGNEYFHRFHDRLVFTTVLFFFALYSYAIFAVPVYTGTMGVGTFIASGVMSIAVFALFTVFLRLIIRKRFLDDVWRIRAGALGVLAVMNLFYFTNILPPLPLSAEAAGVYHSVQRIAEGYEAQAEAEPWQVRYLGFAPTLHVPQGASVYAYSSVFAPTVLRTGIVHHWERYEPQDKEWVTKSMISYSIAGGRDGGYRGYTAAPILEEGKWRVKVETADGRVIARVSFKAEFTEAVPVLETVLLK